MRVELFGKDLEIVLNKENKMNKHSGFTFIGLIIILGLIAFFSTLTLRIVPIYQEYYSVVSVLKSMKMDLKNAPLSKQQVNEQLKKRFGAASISNVTDKDIQLINRKIGLSVSSIVIDYEVRVPFMFQFDLIGHFHDEVHVDVNP